MIVRNRAGLALLAGVVSGAMVLGIMGRAAMVVVAVATSSPTNLSLRGALEVIAMGGLVGAVGGSLLLITGKILLAHPLIQSTLVALALLAGSSAWALSGGRISPDIHAARFLTLSVAAIVFVVYGHVANLLLGHLERLSLRSRNL